MLDVRPVRDYLAGHAQGALNVPVSGSSFATKSGFVLDAAERVVVQAATDDEAQRAVRGLRSVGYLELEGFVLGGGVERIDPVGLDELDRLLEQGAEVIDVRERDERDTGYIAGSRNIPYRLLAVGGPELPTDRPVVTICESGARAGVAASILAARGSTPVRCSTAAWRSGRRAAARRSSSAAAARDAPWTGGMAPDGPHDLPWGHSRYLRDPDGKLVEPVPA